MSTQLKTASCERSPSVASRVRSARDAAAVAHRAGAALAVSVALLVTLQPAVGDVRLPRVFGDHMVMQRDVPLPVWGWAEPGEAIAVRLVGPDGATAERAEAVRDDAAVQTTAGPDGKWSVRLRAVGAGGPYTLRVQGRNTLELTDVLIGEVWICSGQSNMEWGLRASENGRQAVAQATHPELRFLRLGWKTAPGPLDDCQAEWRLCTPENVDAKGWLNPGLTAIGYYFARDLQAELHVPVGIIQTTWGGTRIEGWIPRAGYEAMQMTEPLAFVDEAPARHRAAIEGAIDAYERWLPAARAALTAGEEPAPPPAWPAHPLDNNREPTGIFNGQVAPLIPYAMRGVLWYQGESNRGDGLAYRDKMEALIRGWRTLWNQGEFPFYYVQLAPFEYDDDRGPLALPQIWEAQAAALAIPNTGMAVTVDIGNLADIHPRNKLDVARRLLRWALARTYGRADVVCCGPMFKRMRVDGGTVRVEFEHARGLASRDGEPLTWFTIAGEDRRFFPAEARIDGVAVVLRAAEVPAPVAVRFAWDQVAAPNLVNGEGLPAAPFRTDNW